MKESVVQMTELAKNVFVLDPDSNSTDYFSIFVKGASSKAEAMKAVSSLYREKGLKRTHEHIVNAFINALHLAHLNSVADNLNSTLLNDSDIVKREEYMANGSTEALYDLFFIQDYLDYPDKYESLKSEYDGQEIFESVCRIKADDIETDEFIDSHLTKFMLHKVKLCIDAELDEAEEYDEDSEVCFDWARIDKDGNFVDEAEAARYADSENDILECGQIHEYEGYLLWSHYLH